MNSKIEKMIPIGHSAQDKHGWTGMVVIVCLVLTLVSTGYADQVVGDFESGLDGWTIAWDGTGDLGTSTTGATLNSHSMTVLDGPSDGFWKLERVGMLNLVGAQRIAMDVTFRASEWADGTWINFAKIAIMDHTFWSWQEIDLPDMTVTKISGATPPLPDGSGNVAYWGPWMGDATWTVSWLLRNVTKTNDTYELYLSMSQPNTAKGSAGLVYIDNIRVTAEAVAIPPDRLHVEGNKLKNPDGNEVILRGVSLIDVGFLQDWQGGACAMIDRLTDQDDTNCGSTGWYTNVIRIPVVPPDNVVGWPHPFNPANEDLYNLLRSVVDYCALKNVYAIIDWHDINNTYDRMTQATAFWQYMAPRFADDTHVMYELFNEPMNNIGTDEDNWQSVKADMETLIDTVRVSAPHTVLLVGTPRWCQIIGPTADDPVDDPNVIYVSHIYPWHWINDNLYSTTNLAAAAAAHPVILGEWGFISDSSGGDLDGTITNYGQPLRDFVEGLGISNIAWVASHDWQPPMFDYNSTTHVWSLLSGDGYMGCFVKDWLHGAWISQQDTNIPLTINRCLVTAGKTQRHDAFEASATFTTLPSNILGVTTMDVNIVSVTDGNVIYAEDCNFAWDMQRNRLIWSTKIPNGGKGRITLLMLDLRRRTLVMKASNIDLTGLGSPVRLNVTVGDYRFSGDVNETLINGSFIIPTRLMRTYKDALAVTKASVTNKTKVLSDSLSVKGEIAVQDINNTNLTSESLVITWSDSDETAVRTFTIPAGKFKKAKNANLYKCSKTASTSDTGWVTATIDLDKCTFAISVKGAEIPLAASHGNLKLGLSFGGFNQTSEFKRN